MKEFKENSSVKYEYSLFVYWKQGDELANYLKHFKNNSKEALLAWAQHLRQNAKMLRNLVSQLYFFIYDPNALLLEREDFIEDLEKNKSEQFQYLKIVIKPDL